jgi:hypothetical protein
MTTRCQPEWRRSRHPTLDVKPICASIERHRRLVNPSLWRQQPDRLGGDVRCVGDQDVDAASQYDGQRLVEVAFIYLTTGGSDVAAGTPYCGWVDIGGVQIDSF